MNDLCGIMCYNCVKETPPSSFKPTNEYTEYLLSALCYYRTEELYCYLLNEKNWECDIYILFDKLMSTGHKEMYEFDKR